MKTTSASVSDKLPPVSIYIITYLDSGERGEILKAICRNALAQRYPEFEVVVSDNAGSVKAEEVLSSIDDPRLKVFRNERNLGFAGNMNRCVERCAHDIIKLNCDDDLLHPDCLALTVPYVDDETVVMVDHEEYIIGQEPEELGRSITALPAVETRQPGYGENIWASTYISMPGCSLFTKTMFKALGCYDPDSRIPDWDFMIYARLFKKVVHVREKLCFIGVWAGSITQKMQKERPYFFPTSGLHLRFRLLQEPAVKEEGRRHIQELLRKERTISLLRLIKNIHRKSYRDGFREYMKEYRVQSRRREWPALQKD